MGRLNTLNKLANSAGVLDTVGSLGVKVTDNVSLDISGASGAAYVAVGVPPVESSSSSSVSSVSVKRGKTFFGVASLTTGHFYGIGALPLEISSFTTCQSRLMSRRPRRLHHHHRR